MCDRSDKYSKNTKKLKKLYVWLTSKNDIISNDIYSNNIINIFYDMV